MDEPKSGHPNLYRPSSPTPSTRLSSPTRSLFNVFFNTFGDRNLLAASHSLGRNTNCQEDLSSGGKLIFSGFHQGSQFCTRGPQYWISAQDSLQSHENGSYGPTALSSLGQTPQAFWSHFLHVPALGDSESKALIQHGSPGGGWQGRAKQARSLSPLNFAPVNTASVLWDTVAAPSHWQQGLHPLGQPLGQVSP